MEPALDLILWSDFNYDFHVTLDSTVTQFSTNYRDENLDGKDTVWCILPPRPSHLSTTYARGCEG